MTKLLAAGSPAARAHRIDAAIALCASLALVTACESGHPATAPGTATQTHVLGMVMDGVRRPLAGATVRVQDGKMAGTTVESDVSGQFELGGTLAGTVTLQVTREGFKSATHAARWQPAISVAVDVIRLESLQPSPAQLDPGEYSLTISMDPVTARNLGTLPACAGFPAELMSRTFTATIARSPFPGADRVVSIGGPTVFSNAQLLLLIGGPFVGFETDWPFTEELPGFRYLNVIGHAPTDEPMTVLEDGVSIPFSALFQYCELNSPARRGWENCQHVPAEQMVRFHACASSSARMVFTRH